MCVDPANGEEVAAIARELGADILTGALRYPSETGSWQLGAIDLGEYLDRYRDQRLVLIIAALGEVEPETYTCGTCGFGLNEVGECPRCKLSAQEQAGGSTATGEERDVLNQVADFLAGTEM